ncbi:MAG TPA: cupin domain-containing protein [Tepidisphaeraceae bacterium]|nr:cupin domain-containing protein [Tepidisphaeraceae bacterium]
MNALPGREHPYALKRDEGRICSCGVDFVIKAGEMQPGRGAAVLEYVTRKGEEPADHLHPTEDEMFYVVSGAVSFRCSGQTFDLAEGDFVFLPRGIKHGYTIRSDGPVRLLVITTPVRDGQSGGWGGFVGEMERME